jgi:urease accessory protein
MVAVGVLAAQLGGRALWIVPAAFVSVMAAAGALGMAGVVVPHVELGIALSVIVLGAVIALDLALPVAAATALVGFFAIFHGYVHGAEMPATENGLLFGAGFVTGTALLHAIGVGLGLMIARPTEFHGRRAVRLLGGAAAVAGFGLLAI